MRLPKALSDAVHFASWCQNERQEPAAVARLIVLARRAFNAGEVHCNTGERRRYDNATAAFEKAAAEMGYRVEWPGLWPTLYRDGSEVHLPAL